jgi:hypothetical protein
MVLRDRVKAPQAADQGRTCAATRQDRSPRETTENFISGIVSKSFLSDKLYLVKFVDGQAQPTAEWLRAHVAEVRRSRR